MWQHTDLLLWRFHPGIQRAQWWVFGDMWWPCHYILVLSVSWTWDPLGSKNTHKQEPELGHWERYDSFRDWSGERAAALRTASQAVKKWVRQIHPEVGPEDQRLNKQASRPRGWADTISWTAYKSCELPQWLSGKESACQCRRRGFNPRAGKIPWRRKWQPTPVFLPGESHGQRSLAG